MRQLRGKRCIVLGVAACGLVDRAARSQLLRSVLTQRLEQPERRHVADIGHEHRFVDQHGNEVEGIPPRRVDPYHRGRRVEVEPTGEHREPRERVALRLAK